MKLVIGKGNEFQDFFNPQALVSSFTEDMTPLEKWAAKFLADTLLNSLEMGLRCVEHFEKLGIEVRFQGSDGSPIARVVPIKTQDQ